MSSVVNVYPDLCFLCIRLWMYLSKFQELFNIHVTSVNYIFILLKGLDQIAPQLSQTDDLSHLDASSLRLLHYYSTLCITLLKIILRDFQTIDDSPDPSDPPDSPSSSLPTLLSTVFKQFDIGEACLSLTTWVELARLLFYGSLADSGLLCPAWLRDQLGAAFESVAQKGLLHVDGATMLRLLLALAEMALDASQVGETGKLEGRRGSDWGKWRRSGERVDDGWGSDAER